MSLSYAAQVIADGANHYWRLGETGTVAIDQIGVATAPATITGGVTPNQPGALADGNAALLFDGVTGTVTTPALLFPVPFTWECWVKTTYASPPAPSTDNPLLCNSQVNPAGTDCIQWDQDWHTGGCYCFIQFNNSTVTSTPVTAAHINNGAWHHLVLVVQAASVDIYVDGALQVHDLTSIHFTTPVLQPLTIGANLTQAIVYQGTLDEVATYRTALSPAQITNHYALRTAPGAFFITQAMYANAVITPSGDGPVLH